LFFCLICRISKDNVKEKEIDMTDEDDCKPPLALRDRYGTHWVVRRDEMRGDLTPILMDWRIYNGVGQWSYSEICAEFGWRYLAPVTPHATVAALVEALDELLADTQHATHDCGDDDCPVLRAHAALALYREAGR
jgi:hypothetical protein